MAAQLADVRLEDVDKRFDDVARGRRSRSRFRAGASSPARAVRLRQDDDAAHDRRLRGADRGRDLPRRPSVDGLPPYKRDVNTVFQSYALFPHLTIFENVAFGLRRRGVDGRESRGARRRDARAGRPERARASASRRSSRAASSSASRSRGRSSTSPRVLLLDEPLGALDLKLRKQMQLELKGIQHEVGITFVHVTHDQEEAMTMADTIAVMNGGRIEQLGTPDELYERPRTAFVAGFLGVSNLLARDVDGAGGRTPRRGGELHVSATRLRGTPAASPSASGRRRSGSARLRTAATASMGTRSETRVHRRRHAVRRPDTPARITGLRPERRRPGRQSRPSASAYTRISFGARRRVRRRPLPRGGAAMTRST